MNTSIQPIFTEQILILSVETCNLIFFKHSVPSADKMIKLVLRDLNQHHKITLSKSKVPCYLVKSNDYVKNLNIKRLFNKRKASIHISMIVNSCTA